MTVPGVIAVWSGTEPRFDAFRIPPHADGLVLGKGLVEPTTDDRISRAHIGLVMMDDSVRIADLRSRNGTYLDGRLLETPVVRATVAILRAGRTIFVFVPDVRPYEHIPISRRGALVVGGTLDASCRLVDMAAVDGENLAIVGGRSVGSEFAQSYGRTLGGEVAIFDVTKTELPTGRVASLEKVLAATKRPRTLILDLGSRPLFKDDEATLLGLLETDVRIVTRVQTQADLAKLPVSVEPLLRQRVVVLPTHRLDELPTTLHDRMRELAPDRTIHATAIETCLLELAARDEDHVLERFGHDVDRWLREPHDHERGIRGHHLFEAPPRPLHWCLHGYDVPRRRPR